jgi:hypothetical protein
VDPAAEQALQFIGKSIIALLRGGSFFLHGDSVPNPAPPVQGENMFPVFTRPFEAG